MTRHFKQTGLIWTHARVRARRARRRPRPRSPRGRKRGRERVGGGCFGPRDGLPSSTAAGWQGASQRNERAGARRSGARAHIGAAVPLGELRQARVLGRRPGAQINAGAQAVRPARAALAAAAAGRVQARCALPGRVGEAVDVLGHACARARPCTSATCTRLPRACSSSPLRQGRNDCCAGGSPGSGRRRRPRRRRTAAGAACARPTEAEHPHARQASSGYLTLTSKAARCTGGGPPRRAPRASARQRPRWRRPARAPPAARRPPAAPAAHPSPPESAPPARPAPVYRVRVGLGTGSARAPCLVTEGAGCAGAHRAGQRSTGDERTSGCD